jgi:hypothetical protein
MVISGLRTRLYRFFDSDEVLSNGSVYEIVIFSLARFATEVRNSTAFSLPAADCTQPVAVTDRYVGMRHLWIVDPQPDGTCVCYPVTILPHSSFHIGSSLKVALEMAAKCQPGTRGMGVAWRRTEEALAKLVELLMEERALPPLQAVEARLLKAKRGC